MSDNSLSLLKQTFAETGTQLDRIILAYRRGVPLPHPETIVWYSNDTISSFNIEGELGENSIPDKENAVKVEIGIAVTSIGLDAFQDCSGLTSVTIPDSVTNIGYRVFDRCSGLTSITIPSSVTSIGDLAFYRCSGLTSITIPSSVTSIGDSAFYKCSVLSRIISLRTSAPTVQSSTFGSSNSNYTGRSTYSSGNNVLNVPQGATGYDTGAWLDPLQNATKCGFHIEYI